MPEMTVTLTLPELAAGTEKAEALGRAQSRAEIADWLDGQADEIEANPREDCQPASWAVRRAAEAVRQGRARREGA